MVNKEHWSEWEYDKTPTPDQLLEFGRKCPQDFVDELRLKHIRKYLPRTGTILEVGCGSGRLLTRIGLLNNHRYKVIGLDFVEGSTRLIQSNFNKFNVNGNSIQGNAFDLPIKNNSIDVVMSGGVLEHFDYVKSCKVVQEMSRVLKQDGLFYADIVPEMSSLCRPIVLTKHGEYENNFTKEQWKKILETYGFTDIEIFTGLILPPNFYGWYHSGIQLDIMYKIKPYLNYFDNTIIGDILGFCYYVFAKKR